MDLPGSEYLFNLSLLAITFAAVSVLVMLIRQTMGGKLTNVDVYLIASYVGIDFAIAVDAVLPPLVSSYDVTPDWAWTISSLLAAACLGGTVATFWLQRRRITGVRLPNAVLVTYATHGIDILLLLANALSFKSMSVYGTALTLSLAMLMWTFVRRVVTLLGENVGEDWDPRRG
jgi:hypothetical protein